LACVSSNGRAGWTVRPRSGDLIFVDNDMDVTAETTERGRVVYEAALFIESSTGPGGRGTAVNVQYGATIDLNDPVFVNYRTAAVLSATDINLPWMSDHRVRNARLVNTMRGTTASMPPELGIAEYVDDTLGTRGFYVPAEFPMLVDATSPLRTIVPGEAQQAFDSPTRRAFVVLKTVLAGPGRFFGRDMPGTGMPTTAQLRRSDGYQYAFSQGFVPGYPLITNSAHTYELLQGPNDTMFAVTLDDFGGAFQTQGTQRVQVGYPMPAAPTRVAVVTTGSGNGPDLEPGPGTALTAAASLAAFRAAPATTFFFVTGRNVLHLEVRASDWVVVQR
jgi:hypothetical protein